MLVQVVEAQRTRIAQQLSEQSPPGGERTHAGDRVGVHPVVHEARQARGVVVIDDAERPVARTHQTARGDDDPFEHGVEVEVLRDGEHRVEQSPEAGIDRVQRISPAPTPAA